MRVRYPVTVRWAQISLVASVVLSFWIAIRFIAPFVEPTIVLLGLGIFWGSIGAAAHLDWLKIELKCKACSSFAPLTMEYTDGRAGSRVYPLIRCAECGTVQLM